LVSVIKKPTSGVEDVAKTLTMQEKGTAQHVDLEDQRGSEVTTGRIRKLMVSG
jgi:hypothetical protein